MDRSTNFNFYLPTNADPMRIADLTYNFEQIDSKLAVANNLTTTAAGKVLDARQGKILKDLIDNIGKIVKLETDSVTSFTLNATGGDIHFIAIGTNNATGEYVGFVSTVGSGAFSIAEIYKGNSLTINTSVANKFTVSSSLTARKYYIFDICLNGSNFTL